MKNLKELIQEKLKVSKNKYIHLIDIIGTELYLEFYNILTEV